MIAPCVIARPLETAERLLREAGVSSVEIKQTRPPKGGPSGPCRVIRQRATPSGIELVTAASALLAEREAPHD